MIQDGIGLPYNLIPSCVVLVNRDVVQNLLQSFKMKRTAAIRSGPSGPRDINGIVQGMMKKNKEALDEGKKRYMNDLD